MASSYWHWVQGVVTIQVTGPHIEQFMNRCHHRNILLQNARFTASLQMEAQLTFANFMRLRTIRRETKSHIRIVSKKGLPILLRSLKKRVLFFVGFFIFLCAIFALSSLVWKIDVIGNEKIDQAAVLRAAKAQGVYVFQWQFRMPTADELQRQLLTQLPDAAWIGVTKRGTKVTIRIVENTVPPTQKSYSPRHLVAKYDAVVTDIQPQVGKAIVKRNTYVKRGDILISGWIGDEQNPTAVAAQGEVLGLVWYHFKVESPLTKKVHTYTGRHQLRWYVQYFGRTLLIRGFKRPPYKQLRVERQRWKSGKIREMIREIAVHEQKITVAEARAIGLKQARTKLLAQLGKGSTIRTQNILHEKAGNGKVYLDVFYEVEQSIATGQPLVQKQGE